MKYISYIKIFVTIFILSLFIPVNTFALQESEIANRNVCPSFELAIANADGSLTNVGCYDSYDASYNTMYITNNDDLVILQRANGVTTLIDAKYAIAYLSKGSNSNTINLYKTNSTGYAWTYITAGTSYASNDAAYMGIDYGSKKAHVMISGFNGYVNKIDSGIRAYEVIPLAWIKSINYYTVTDTTISHYLTYDVSTDNNYNGYVIGPKPMQLNSGKYYSYDGNYFYTDIKVMLNDYRAGVRTNSVNRTSPYYNYYQYLPVHSKTTYSMSEIDNYINSLSGSRSFSYMYGLGYSFYNAQEKYGANALINMSLARQESGTGTSKISRQKYNLFGHAAYDSSAYNSSTNYVMPEESVYVSAYNYMTYGYSFPSDSRYFGGQLGNKANGMNVKYSSDPYWGEKIAALYYQTDSALGLQDYNYYNIAIKNSDEYVYPNQQANTSNRINITDMSDNIYSYAKSGTAVLIIGEVTGSDGTLWYKIQSDSNLDSNGNYIPKNANRTLYNFDNNYVYVPARLYNVISSGSNTPSNVTTYNEINYTYKYYQKNSKDIDLKGAYLNNGATIYNSPNLSNASGSLVSGQYVLVYASAYDENGNLKSYLVSSNYEKGHRSWIEPSKLNFISGEYGRIIIDNSSGTFVNVRNSANGSVIGRVSDGNYFYIFDTTTVGGNVWYHISYNNGSGWIVDDNEQSVTKFVLNNENIQVNTAPVINASDKSIAIGSVFDYTYLVSASDMEDGDITSRITYVATVNTSVAGTYQVTYNVSDNAGVKTSKTINVTVTNDEPVINASNKQIYQGDEFDYMNGVSATDTEDGDVTSSITYKGSVNTSIPGEYKVTYSATDKYGLSSTKEITVTVKKDEPVINATDRVIMINDEFNYLDNVSATDRIDGDITSKITYSGDVNVAIPGIYNIEYKVTNNKGVTTIKTITITVGDYKSGKFVYAYNGIKYLENNSFEISGFLAVQGMNNSTSDSVIHYVIFKNDESGKEYYFKLDNWLDSYPYEMISMDDDKNYNYNSGWFKGEVDLSVLPAGDYTTYVEVMTNDYKTRRIYNNLTYGEQPSRVTYNDRGYEFKMDFSLSTRPLNVIIRDNGLISTNTETTEDDMINLFSKMTMSDGKLNIKGRSYNIGKDYSVSANVTRNLILENTSTFERFENNIGSITTGDYEIILAIPDGLSKTRAWFDTSIDISNLSIGSYAIYIKTETNGFSDYGELRDLTYSEFTSMTYNGKTYTLKCIDEKRSRVELIVS